MNLIDSIYQSASLQTGKSEEELRKMAQDVFATMLFHAAHNLGATVTTTMVMDPLHDTAPIRVEVDSTLRKPTSIP